MSAYALSGSNLVSFDQTNPTVGTTIPITGLTLGDTLVGIDFRPQNGFLYGLGVGGGPAGSAQLYAISAQTGQATAIGAPITFVDAGGNPLPITGSNFGFDFNPTVDRIRVTTDTGLNFRINPNNGAPVDGNAGAGGTQPDGSINGATTTVDASAYTNSQPNVTVTTLYNLSAATDQLFIQNPPNNGTQTVPINITLGGNPLDFSASNGFDIAAGVNVAANNAVASGSGLALLTVGGTTGLYSIDLTTGAATKVGNLLNGTTPASGLAIENGLGGIPAIALSADGTTLVRFNTANPGTVTSVPISGVVAGEVIVGIDFRPQTGQLFAFGVNAATNTGTLYRLDPQPTAGTNLATAIGTPGQIAFVDAMGNPIDLPAGGYGMDFNPTVDRVRITTDSGLNFRINPNNGAPVDGDATTAGTINPDGAINGLPPGSTGASANAYTNSFGQSLTGGVTTLYTLDAASNSLFIQNPPNAGTQTTQVTVKLGGSPLDFTSVNGFDIPADVRVAASNSVAAGLGLAGLTVGGAHSLYLISLVSGDAVNLGPIGAGLSTAGLALADSPNDFYLVDDPGDVVAETPSGGNDTAVTGLASYTLAANVENLIGTSATGQALTGNALNNAITGGMGGDSLGGGLGNDALTGGAGDDTFKFGPFGGMDAIADLAAGAGTIDRIDLRAMLQIHSLNDVLARATQVGADTVIDFGAGDALRLTGVNRASLSADDFMFSKATDLASGHDFGGGAADFLLQQESGGIRTLQIAPVIGNVAQSPVVAAQVGIDWIVDGAADFDRDGDSDILLHQDSGGVRNLLVYQMQGNAVQAANIIGQIGADLQNGGLGDFDGDADNDILLFRQVGDTKTLLTLQMEGGIVQGANNLGQVGADFQIDRIGDFDRDGDGDILLHQDAGGVRKLLILEMNGGAVVAGRSLGQVGLETQIGGVGDFDRDGDGDVLLFQDVGGTRNLLVLEVEGNAVQSGQAIGQVGANVQIGGVGDFDQDGDADISLQSVTGASTQLSVLAIEDNAIAAASNAASLGLDILQV